MKQNPKNTETKKTETPSVNYELKSKAVDDLLSAEAGDAPEYDREELEKYRSRKGLRLPQLLKIALIKAWFAGAVCYFILWGLGIYLSSTIDMMFILGVVLGMVTDLLVNSALRFLEKTPGENEQWLMVRQKGVMGFFLNIFYGFVLLFCVYMLYNLINYVIIAVTGKTDTVPLGVEPVLFGTFFMAFDMLFVFIKQRIKRALDKT